MQTQTKRPKLEIHKRALLDFFESVPGRVEMLPQQDRAFVRLFLVSQKIRLMAAMAGKHEATIARRLKRIAARISANNFVATLSDEKLSKDEMQILRDYFVDGIAMLKIARNRNLNYYVVRKIIKSRMTA